MIFTCKGIILKKYITLVCQLEHSYESECYYEKDDKLCLDNYQTIFLLIENLLLFMFVRDN